MSGPSFGGQGLTAAGRGATGRSLGDMQELHDTFDKLGTEVDHLDRLLDREDLDIDQVKIALSVAKRVRVESTLLVRHLAALRDKLQAR